MDPASISSQQLRLRSVIIFTPEGVVKRMLEICSKDRVCTGSYWHLFSGKYFTPLNRK